MTITVDTWIVAAATIIGPAVAVTVGYWLQKSLLSKQQELQSTTASKAETDRRTYELDRTSSEQKLWENWKIAERDRENALRHALARVAAALEEKNKQI
jgi:predicted Holliday junction resolvase-like endonuclease